MTFSDTQLRTLSGKLHEKHVRTREQRGVTLSYIEGWHAIDEANRIFGFDGWDRETVWSECLWQDLRSSAKACAYAARVRIRVRAGDIAVVRDGSGVGHGSGATIGEAHESALKEAETDATKRALTTFGNLFGLALYDKAQNGVRRSPKPNGGTRWVSWAVIGSNGELLGKHETPENFCSGLREAIAAVSRLKELEALWSHNRYTLGHLRTYFRDLKTEKGVHFVDILERLYRRRRVELEGSGQAERPDGDGGQIDKSELALSTPKRIRDVPHRRHVASLPCLICARTPSYAHHLRFAQPRSMGSKVSDEWTVPLCGTHHRALHDVGNEEHWWEEHGIDAKAEAERLWAQRHGETSPVTPPEPLPLTGNGG